MTRDDLIKFLTETYEPNEQLVWQTISYKDVADGIYLATPDYWEDYVYTLGNYNRVAENFSDNVFSEFREFVENLYKREEDNK